MFEQMVDMNDAAVWTLIWFGGAVLGVGAILLAVWLVYRSRPSGG